ncbi:MAG: TolC family protein, partial [Bacteroidales bacterium]|nr:TolC family protein [Bacteroidales bacterium]
MRNIILLLLFAAGFCQKSYSQNTLQYYINEAKLNSPLINKSKNDIKITELDLKQIKRVLSIPEIRLQGSVLFAPIVSHDNNTKQFQLISDDANSYTGYDLAYSDGGQYQAFISVKQPLFTGKTYKSYYEQANIQDKININNIELTKRKLEQLVGYQYILCLTAKNQAEISKSLIDKLNNQILILQKLVDNAIYKQTDLMLLKIETENFNIEYEKYLTEYSRNLFDLNLLC